MTQPELAALRAEAARGHRRARLAERLSSNFWMIPAVLLAVGAAVAVLTVQAARLGVPHVLLGGPPVTPGEAAGVLGIVASATLTFLGVVFTLTLVALQLASSQLSPRVLRMFVRSGVTKLAFGILLATFSYAVAFLALAAGAGHRADPRGLVVAMALVCASLILFVRFAARIMKLLQVDWVITGVAEETRKALRWYFPAAAAYRAAAPTAAGRGAAEAAVVSLPADGRRIGVLQGVDHRRLIRLARRAGGEIELLARVGEYLPAGAAVLAVRGQVPPRTALLRCLDLGRARTLYQDPAYGLRQLVDIAIQALSPAVNQPTTAVHVIDRLEDLVLRVAGRPARSSLIADAGGRVRVVQPALTWEECLDLAFTEITDYGASSVQVVRRLLAAYDAIEAAAGPGRRDGLARRRAALLDRSADGGLAPASLRPDPLGLG